MQQPSAAALASSASSVVSCINACNTLSTCALVTQLLSNNTCFAYAAGSFQYVVASNTTNIWRKQVNGYVLIYF